MCWGQSSSVPLFRLTTFQTETSIQSLQVPSSLPRCCPVFPGPVQSPQMPSSLPRPRPVSPGAAQSPWVPSSLPGCRTVSPGAIVHRAVSWESSENLWKCKISHSLNKNLHSQKTSGWFKHIKDRKALVFMPSLKWLSWRLFSWPLYKTMF